MITQQNQLDNRAKVAIHHERQRLRDEFAKAALTGILSIGPIANSLENIALASYELADAMMKARVRK